MVKDKSDEISTVITKSSILWACTVPVGIKIINNLKKNAKKIIGMI
jgi:hypothetical protein